MTGRAASGVLGLLLLGSTARAAEPAPETEIAQLRSVIRGLEQRLADLETSEAERVRDEVRAAFPSVDAREHWSDRVRLGGSTSLTYQDGQDNSPFDEATFNVWDSRLFIDADLARDVSSGGHLLARDVGFTLEWELIRLGRNSQNQSGEIYADFRGVLGQDWLNLQIGRFQLPFGEAYKLYSRGYANRPFVTNPLAGPWWWDEGVRVHGDFAGQRLGYVFAWSNGESLGQTESDADKAATLKLWARPFEWLDLSVSGHHSGKLGSPATAGESALWLGESWIRGIGVNTTVPTWSHGVIVPDGGTEFDGVTAVGADALWHWGDRAHGWFGYGTVQVDQHIDHSYDRDLRYWIAEVIVEGGWLARELAPFYAGLRANGLGTYDRDEGYLLDMRYLSTAGFNMRSLEAYSLVLGWHLGERLTLRAEYSLVDIDLVRGVTPAIRDAVDDANSLALELGLSF